MPGTVGAAAGNPAAAFRPQLVTVDTPTRGVRARLSELELNLTEHAAQDYVEVVLHSAADLARLTAVDLVKSYERNRRITRLLDRARVTGRPRTT